MTHILNFSWEKEKLTKIQREKKTPKHPPLPLSLISIIYTLLP